MYGSEVRTLSKRDGNTLPVRERKMRRRISGLVKENGVWMIYSNQELMDPHTELDIV